MRKTLFIAMVLYTSSAFSINIFQPVTFVMALFAALQGTEASLSESQRWEMTQRKLNAEEQQIVSQNRYLNAVENNLERQGWDVRNSKKIRLVDDLSKVPESAKYDRYHGKNCVETRKLVAIKKGRCPPKLRKILGGY